MNSLSEIRQCFRQQQTRRVFLGRSAQGVGAMALASLISPNDLRAAAAGSDRWPGVVNPYHFPPRARRVIWLTMAGGPSHLETFDYKPKLAEMHGQPMPESFTKGKQIAQLQGQKLMCFGPQLKFQRFGKAGIELCELFPNIGSVADDICWVRSMTSEAINHDPAHMFMNTGSQIAGRPWAAGLLPSRFQGVHLRGKGDPVMYLGTPKGVTRGQQQDVVQAINRLNAQHDAVVDDPEISTRIAQYEMAFQMQASVPELMDVSREPGPILDLYGCQPGDGSFAANCLLARRLAERGVRFIQLYHKDWDHHGEVKRGVELKAAEVDRACRALIADLKQRDLLRDTLVVWAGEFGRTPMSQGGDGRDHHNAGFTVWLCGGGIQPGIVYGATDELGYAATENPVDVHDLHATMLRVLGIEHTRLSVKFQGLDVRLTGIAGNPIQGILA
jgi:hypothetical protein